MFWIVALACLSEEQHTSRVARLLSTHHAKTHKLALRPTFWAVSRWTETAGVRRGLSRAQKMMNSRSRKAFWYVITWQSTYSQMALTVAMKRFGSLWRFSCVLQDKITPIRGGGTAGPQREMNALKSSDTTLRRFSPEFQLVFHFGSSRRRLSDVGALMSINSSSFVSNEFEVRISRSSYT